MPLQKTCERCGKIYQVPPSQADQQFCSVECRRNRVTKYCEICNTAFEIEVSRAQKEFCCSKNCRNQRLRRIRQQQIENKFGKPIHELLTEMYFEQGLGLKEISKRIGVSDRVLWDWFESLSIPRRSRTDAVKEQWKGNTDGEYWHSKPKQKARDNSKDAYLRACGYTVLRLAEQIHQE